MTAYVSLAAKAVATPSPIACRAQPDRAAREALNGRLVSHPVRTAELLAWCQCGQHGFPLHARHRSQVNLNFELWRAEAAVPAMQRGEFRRMRCGPNLCPFGVFHGFSVHHDLLAFANEGRNGDANAIVEERRLETVCRRLAFHHRLRFADRARHFLRK